jgi:hypothetical protein
MLNQYAIFNFHLPSLTVAHIKAKTRNNIPSRTHKKSMAIAFNNPNKNRNMPAISKPGFILYCISYPVLILKYKWCIDNPEYEATDTGQMRAEIILLFSVTIHTF